jgi:uncharacterized repeat protein (TIGR02543 family)
MNENHSQFNQKDELPDSGGSSSASEKKTGGLYKNAKISVKSLNIIILIGIAALVGATIFLVSHGGFTVTFDTDGGSYVESQRHLYGELVAEPQTPVREGWHFTGWYLDRTGTTPWQMDSDTVTESITLYAGWERDT